MSLPPLLSACLGELETLSQEVEPPISHVRFNPLLDIYPYPNNYLFKDSQDGTLNIPYSEESTIAVIKEPLNTLDGFSTIAPITAQVSAQIDEQSMLVGESVHVYEVELSEHAGEVTSITRELDGTEYMLSLDNSTPSQLLITPLHPLKAKTSYLVALTNDLMDIDGNSIEANNLYTLCKQKTSLISKQNTSTEEFLSDEEAQEMEYIRLRTRAAEQAILAFDKDLQKKQISLSWSFSTQSIDDALLAVKASVDSAPPPVSSITDFNRDTQAGLGKVYTGTLTLPYYLDIATADNPNAPIDSYWKTADGGPVTRFDPMPAVTTIHDIPLIMTIPKSSKPDNGWPIVIFLHGSTSSRAALLTFADVLAEQGMAAVAIDLPLHGITDPNPNGTEFLRMEGLERTFGIDIMTNDTPIFEPDGNEDSSGSHFIKVSKLLTSRDNIRQGVADMFGLRRALTIMDYDGDDVADFDTSDIRFIGHSMGATVGAVYLGLEDSIVSAATLGMPGSGIAKQMDGSAISGPSIAEGMATNDLIKGTPEYEEFLTAFQMIMDSTDPINFATTAAQNRAMHMIEVVGGNSSPPDQIVPNNVLNIEGTVPSPTAGTDPLWQTMGLSVTNESLSGEQLKVVVRFNAGHHSSLISSFDADGNIDPLSEAVMREMQSQTASFMVSGGRELVISDTSVVE